MSFFQVLCNLLAVACQLSPQEQLVLFGTSVTPEAARSEVQNDGGHSIGLIWTGKEISNTSRRLDTQERFWLFASHYDSPAEPHPFWIFEGARLTQRQCYLCSVVMLFAGLLCSAGGIGGGGIYVTVLMIAGQLSVHDAVPLSKAIVFFGSLSSLVLNLRKSFRGISTDATQTLIDYNIVRLVVPAALIGTYLGVFLNNVLGSFVILILLTTTLVFLSVMVTRTYLNQVADEKRDSECALSLPPSVPTASRSPRYGSFSEPLPLKRANSLRNQMTTQDVALALPMLVIVVICGVFQFHARACLGAISTGDGLTWHAACHHPLFFFLPNGLEGYMQGSVTGAFLLLGSFAVPLGTCVAIAAHYMHRCVRCEHWCVLDVAVYEVMAITTGCLAGLVGIGGGLIFSPFFLLMGVEPAIAVATSSTCVLFTSSSTTLQYLLTDRVITSLTVAYGLVNLVASYVGTSFVHYLQDTFGARRSYITAIVGTGVFISAGLSTMKLLRSTEHVHN